MDLYPGHDMYDSFCSYQGALLSEFDRMSSEFNFEMVDASPDSQTVCEHLKKNILQLLDRIRESPTSRVFTPIQRGNWPAASTKCQELSYAATSRRVRSRFPLRSLLHHQTATANTRSIRNSSTMQS